MFFYYVPPQSQIVLLKSRAGFRQIRRIGNRHIGKVAKRDWLKLFFHCFVKWTHARCSSVGNLNITSKYIIFQPLRYGKDKIMGCFLYNGRNRHHTVEIWVQSSYWLSDWAESFSEHLGKSICIVKFWLKNFEPFARIKIPEKWHST